MRIVKISEGATMRSWMTFLATCVLAAIALAGDAETRSVTWTGWFSDLECASSRAAAGTFTATNPDCSKKCIEKGIAPVFVSEQAKALYKIKDYSHVIEDLGYHVEITALVDEAVRTVSIQKVTRLSFDGAACARPKSGAAKK
jgi:hypothetical protein